MVEHQPRPVARDGVVGDAHFATTHGWRGHLPKARTLRVVVPGMCLDLHLRRESADAACRHGDALAARRAKLTLEVSHPTHEAWCTAREIAAREIALEQRTPTLVHRERV